MPELKPCELCIELKTILKNIEMYTFKKKHIIYCEYINEFIEAELRVINKKIRAWNKRDMPQEGR